MEKAAVLVLGVSRLPTGRKLFKCQMINAFLMERRWREACAASGRRCLSLTNNFLGAAAAPVAAVAAVDAAESLAKRQDAQTSASKRILMGTLKPGVGQLGTVSRSSLDARRPSSLRPVGAQQKWFSQRFIRSSFNFKLSTFTLNYTSILYFTFPNNKLPHFAPNK